jgi:predicted metal-dependent hydrolase
MPLLFRSEEALDQEAAFDALGQRLSTLLREPVDLVMTDNRRTMISSRHRNGAWLVRLHHMFVDADDQTVRSLARYIARNDRRAGAHLDTYIRDNEHRIKKERRRVVRVHTRGRHHDLSAIFDELNQRWFHGRVSGVRVTWGRRPAEQRRRRRRSIRLGTYVAEDRLIRIHPFLDQDWVPQYFVAYVVFHEMLHHLVPAPVRNGRQCFHSREFRILERAYPDYDRALSWERKNLPKLLRY